MAKMPISAPIRGNCVFCGTHYTGMLVVLDEAVCHSCWKEIIVLAKKADKLLEEDNWKSSRDYWNFKNGFPLEGKD